ncbi:MAG: 4-(cytidine 5'-diphospho)-2-C-methyl-D-erythritol kinase [Candidatus Pelagibacter sp.]
MKVHRLKSNAKININLNIIGKSVSKKIHFIESLVVFIGLSDLINIQETNYKSHEVIFKGRFYKGITKKNTVIKLLNILDKKKILGKKKYKIVIKKNIPQKSGMGGGSMNAATILCFFIKKGLLNIKQAKICAKKISSDVILGLTNKSKILHSNGNVKEIKRKIKYNVLLVKPFYGCSTKEIFAMNKIFSKKQYFLNKKANINDRTIVQSKNDLEISAFKKYSKLKILKNKLLENQKAEFVRMTGSGSTLVMYFKSKVSAKKALKMYKRKLNKCWCILSKII